MVIGYTTGVFDLFHIGHLKLLQNAKGLCDRLVVGVTTDELAGKNGKHPVIPFEERIEIVRNIRCVDAAVPQRDLDKLAMCRKLHASVLFVGDDWYQSQRWQEYERQFQDAGIRIVYFPYTQGVSSSKIAGELKREEQSNEG